MGCKTMNFLFLSTHAFLPTTRKTSVHFVSRSLADRGHDVDTISVGYSLLTYFKKKTLYLQLLAQHKNHLVTTAPRYRSACYLPLLHPFSLRQAMLNAMIAPFFTLYGRFLPGFMKDSIRRADVVVIESGTALVFFDAIRRINPKARTLYFARDRLDTVGASKYLQRMEEEIAPRFDRIVVPSARMAERFLTMDDVAIVPQGIDKGCFDSATASPYPPGSLNAIVVGNMLFDKDAVTAMAEAAPNVVFHLFGGGIPTDFPGNVRIYGERPFAEIVPYIKFADFGIAPYRLTERELYLVESSLKLQQYSYCGLPILAPDLMMGSRENIVAYKQRGETDWAGKVRMALTMRHEKSWCDGILTWGEISEHIEVAMGPA